jgi:hypothetical protein
MKDLSGLRGSCARLALAATATLAALSCSPDRSGPTGPGASPSLARQAAQQQGLATAIAAQERHNPQLLAMSGVAGTAVGFTADGHPAVLIFTQAAGVSGLPQSLDGVPVDVQVTGRFTALPALQAPVVPEAPPPGKSPGSSHGGHKVDPTTRFARPVPIGVSTGNAGECSAGTISARVRDASGNAFALSNNHVYALENSAPIGSDVLQPGLYNTNCAFDANNVLGTLAAFNTIDFSGGSNTIDAALAATTTANLGNATPVDGYGTPSSTTVSATIGQAVQKYGRSSSLTAGSITGVNATILVGYLSGTATFTDQIVVQSKKPFIKAGDSGSLLVTDDVNANPVGLLFAGNQNGSYAVANRIDLVLAYFGVSIDGK